jgi:hypothetical protein
MAARGGHTETVVALGKLGADMSIEKYADSCPVYIAAKLGHLETVRVLVQELKADPNNPDYLGRTPLLYAAASGLVDVVRVLVQECGVDPAAANYKGETPVYVAAKAGETETVRALVQELNADPNTANDKGKTPLASAAKHGHPQTVWTLVRGCGVDPTGLNRSRQQLLAFAMALHPRLGGASWASALDDCLLKLMLAPHLAPGPLASEIAERNNQTGTARLLRWLAWPEGATPNSEEVERGYPYVEQLLGI